MLIFVEGGKPEKPERNPQSKETTNNKPMPLMSPGWHDRTQPHCQICRTGVDANEIQILYKHHKVSSLVKSHQNTHNSVKYDVI